ncbi:hypothetical protein GCM10010230_55140 [Streptomyces narbonensis]|nr:hypothetical protein GCM10010230_55140 [Streptomyces narbonensis]
MGLRDGRFVEKESGNSLHSTLDATAGDSIVPVGRTPEVDSWRRNLWVGEQWTPDLGPLQWV